MNFIEVFDNALSTEDCKYVIDFMNTEGVLAPGMVSREKGVVVDEDYKRSHEITMYLRGDVPKHLQCWSNYDSYDNINILIGKSLIENTNHYVRIHPQLNSIGKWSVTERYNLQRYYPDEGYYALHCESSNQITSSRILAWMFYLNTVKDGGTYFENYDLSMKAVEGCLVIWPAYWTHFHRGIVSKTETKYIATGWFSFVDSV